MNESTINLEKKRLRAIVKELKSNYKEDENRINSNLIFNKIENLSSFQTASNILIYWSIKGEVQTHDFILKWYQKKSFSLPVMVGETLELRKFSGIESLVESKSFGILEPLNGEIVNPNNIDFAIIPGVAFDKNGNRLGRGKGFYDRLLNQVKSLKVGVGYNFQVFDAIPMDYSDLAVDLVVTN